MTSIVFSHVADGLYANEAYPSLFLHDREPYATERTLTNFAKDDSCLIFCERPPADLSEFKLRVNTFRRDKALKVAWLKAPELFDDPSALRGLRIQEGKLLDRGLFRFRHHTLFIFPGSVLEAGDDALTIHPPVGKSSPANYMTQHGTIKTGTVHGDVIIELARSRPGRLKINMELNETDLNLLDAGIRYFFPASDAGSGRIDSLRFPVFSPAERNLKCTTLLHPLHSLKRDNELPETLFQFSPSEGIETYFRTPLGRILSLTPQDGAGLVFERKMQTLKGKNSDAWYLSPWGSFVVDTHGATFPSLMAGSTGTEFVQGGYDSNNFYMTFRSGCNAYMADFSRNEKSDITEQIQQDSLLPEDAALTSYVRFHGGLATYFAQPSEQPFYLPRGPENSAAFLAAPVCNLADRPAGSIPPIAECVPVLPLSGIDITESDVALRLEQRMASPLRNERMKRLQQGVEGTSLEAYSPIPVNSPGGVSFGVGGSLNGGAGDGISAVTSGGYVGTFSHDMSQWKRLVITSGSDKKPFAINNISGPLRNALLTSRRLTVISDPILFLQNDTALENPLLNIAGWGFDLDPELWLRSNTVLVFKDHPESMEALIKRPDEWTEGLTLNIDPWDISERLLESAELARKAVEGGDLDFAPFLYQIWQNPNWNGFIAFNVQVSPVGFPDDLAVIAGGVDPSILKAHHLGVSSSAIERNESGHIASGQGALFGMVNYDDDALSDETAAWSWTVRKLRARFRNSRLQSFQARIDLSVRELFGEKASTTINFHEKIPVAKKAITSKTITTKTISDVDRPADTIILAGHYEEHDGKGRYTFRSSEKIPFYIDSGVLEEIVLDRAGFETISVTRSAGGTQMDVLGRFLLSGHMKFCALDSFDIFSYDKIPMKNVALNLSFSVVAKAKETPVSDLSFSIEPMRIQTDASEARDSALASRFPLALHAIRALPAGGMPNMRLAPVVSPISQTKRDVAGYLMEYRMDLEIGSIKSFLTLLWWPNGKNSAVYMGLRIPGFDGSFSMVDDLIKIGPQQIQFKVDPDSRETILLFRRIGIEMPLGISLPMDGSIDAALFGDPAGTGSGGKIAWYAAWNKPV